MPNAPALAPPPNTGLCSTCQHLRLHQSARGSVFVLCGAHKEHETLSKYPGLPVVECVGYEEKEK